ncbi:hypothetical protein [Hoylesella saccharolytica]|uniref:hypothetical protein n=1 Tax=Hoylesella saccharolytica TaxID=633701 RepID=UPI000A6A212B|nr:hypothetical protein [Hoylesella saccharolytica]
MGITSYPELVQNCFRVSPKASPHRRHVFGHPRKSADIASTVSGHPEEQKN